MRPLWAHFEFVCTFSAGQRYYSVCKWLRNRFFSFCSSFSHCFGNPLVHFGFFRADEFFFAFLYLFLVFLYSFQVFISIKLSRRSGTLKHHLIFIVCANVLDFYVTDICTAQHCFIVDSSVSPLIHERWLCVCVIVAKFTYIVGHILIICMSDSGNLKTNDIDFLHLANWRTYFLFCFDVRFVISL